MISGIGPMEIAIVLVIALVVLGPKRLPAAGRSLGQGLREFKDGVIGREPSDDRATLEPAPPDGSA
jgi:sec-independent protein translocase protein TatA